jgi:hypothetical protein
VKQRRKWGQSLFTFHGAVGVEQVLAQLVALLARETVALALAPIASRLTALVAHTLAGLRTRLLQLPVAALPILPEGGQADSEREQERSKSFHGGYSLRCFPCALCNIA